MVFPALFSSIDQGITSQFSVYLTLIFSYLLNRFKKIAIGLLIVVSLGIGISLFNQAYAIGANPYACGTMCMANQNYYGTPWGHSPIYYYPSMNYHSLYGPTPYYFRPYPPSPYQPHNCVSCMMRYQQFSQPYTGWGGGMPFTNIQVPLRPDEQKQYVL